MITIITRQNLDQHLPLMLDMYRLRHRVFRERLDWAVISSGGMEMDEFDLLNPVYIIQHQTPDTVTGCARLLPTIGPYMLRDKFSALLNGNPAPNSAHIWESSRFALDLEQPAPFAVNELLAGICEFSIENSISKVVTVCDIYVERLLKRNGAELERIGNKQRFGKVDAVAGYINANEETLQKIISSSNFMISKPEFNPYIYKAI
jgi:acyl homoserine lactone synthase